jgi:two-component system, cell cycle sensor histidine kinase and response regulator CckA
VIEVVREVTRERTVEAQLRQAQKMEAIGTLAGGIAHDFNNILAVMMGYTEMSLSRTGDSEYVKNNLLKILTCIRRAGDLVKQILTFSRQTEQEKRPIELAPAIEEAVKLIRASIPANIEIRQNIADLPNRFVLAEPTQIHQVVLNLCANAAHAMRKTGGLLEVSLTEEDTATPTCALVLPPGPCLKLTVRDTGCGIDPSILDRIFDPFFTTKEVGEGTGMGLSVTHGIVKSHGGAITVTSEPGSGATFEIYLPRLIDPVLAQEVAEDVEPVPMGTGTILLVDDEWMLVDVGRKLLVKLGYSVEALTDSAEAMNLFRAEPHRFDLVITDLTMPRIMGLELAASILRIRPDIPVILCTGYNQNISGEDVKAAGITGLITKPFTLKTMGNAVRKALTGGRNRSKG